MRLFAWLRPSDGWLSYLITLAVTMWCWHLGYEHAMAKVEASQQKAMQSLAREAFQAGLNAATERKTVEEYYDQINKEVQQHATGEWACSLDDSDFTEWVRLHNRLANPD